jgi:integrase
VPTHMSTPTKIADRKDWALTPAERIDAREALQILHGTGITLKRAAEQAVVGRKAIRRVSCSEAASMFLRDLLQRKARTGTFNWYDQRLTYWTKTFNERMLDDVPRSDLTVWLNGLGCGPVGRAHYARAIRALLRWALRQDPPLVGADITPGLVPRQPPKETEVRFLTVEQAKAILAGAGDYTNTLALGLFAGLRPEEIAGKGKPWLKWGAVNVQERIIRIPADVAKTRKGRIMEGLPDALWKWLNPPAVPEGKASIADVEVSPGRARQIARKARELAGYGPGGTKGKWPVDCIRHTFATYAFARDYNKEKVSAWLGHEGESSVFYRHYRGLTTKAEAEKFFALTPQAGTMDVPPAMT